MANPDNDNRSNQMNPNNDEYWHARDLEARPEDWAEQVDESDGKKSK